MSLIIEQMIFCVDNLNAIKPLILQKCLNGVSNNSFFQVSVHFRNYKHLNESFEKINKYVLYESLNLFQLKKSELK